MNLTPSQDKVLSLVRQHGATNARLFILWYGGIRAGKTYGMVRAAIEHSLTRERTNYIVGGYVLRSIINNITPYFETICIDMNLKYKVVSGGINPRVEVAGNQFLFYGGDRASRSKNIQGATASGLLLDEFELLDRDFVKQCEARISSDNALRIYTSNKGQPYSWAKREYYDRAVSGEIEATLIDSNPEENTFIGSDFWNEKTNEYDDYYKQRFIDNEFTLPNEPLYEPQRVDAEGELEFTTVYSYGKDHFTLPVSKRTDGVFVLGNITPAPNPIPPETISRYGRVLVNATAGMLGRELVNKRYSVRGYSDMFAPHKVELCQRAFAQQRVAVCADAGNTIEAIDTHAFPEFNANPAVSAIECSVEYLSRMNRWN